MHRHDGTEFIYTVCIYSQSLQHSTSLFQFIKILDRVSFMCVYTCGFAILINHLELLLNKTYAFISITFDSSGF